jgi:Ca2+-binding RTX toxin-like protein
VSSESGSVFQCSRDGAPFTTCTSPKRYTGLAAGGHTFSVRARDAAGNTDPTPATRKWTISRVRWSSAGATTRTGTARRDILRGTPAVDILRGLGGADVLYGLGSKDILSAGPGRDVVHAADGVRDTIACGSGRDLVYADAADRIGRDCELVRRRR